MAKKELTSEVPIQEAPRWAVGVATLATAVLYEATGLGLFYTSLLIERGNILSSLSGEDRSIVAVGGAAVAGGFITIGMHTAGLLNRLH